jgi:hypothetical protein
MSYLLLVISNYLGFSFYSNGINGMNGMKIKGIYLFAIID